MTLLHQLPFATKAKSVHIPITLVRTKDTKSFLAKQKTNIKTLARQNGFGSAGQVLFVTGAEGEVEKIIASVPDKINIYDIAPIAEAIRKYFASDFLKTCSFAIEGAKDAESDNIAISWGLASYQFASYKKASVKPVLIPAPKTRMKRVEPLLQSIFMLKDLINTPANDLGPDAMEKTARNLVESHKGKIEVIKGAKLISGFPLIHMVGKAAKEEPRLIDIRWGKTSDPKLTIVGKGVCFDTGGLNIKPSAYMALMKKDMGGAAHALALGRLVMELKIPVNLRILVATVENSISADAFRPGDISKSRKGLTVENTNTDAEGRLILADALTYACEDKPDLLIDFATLTGSARAGLGPDIPAFFATNLKTGAKLQKLSESTEDPVWMMPLWDKYKKHIESSVADLVNSSNVPGDLIFSAVFLKQFLTSNPDWIHMDCYSWEHTGRPGRPRGGADTGLLSMLALLEDRYA